MMNLKIDKSKVIYIGIHNPDYPYKMMGSKLAVTSQRDLRVIVDSSLKPCAPGAAADKS